MSEKRVVIVTGAGSGIGRATAIELAKSGVDLVLVGRTAATLEETASLIGDLSAVAIEPIDITDAGLSRDMVKRVLTRFGRVDGLANVAGYAPMQPIDQVTPELWQRTIDTNLSYVVQLTATIWDTFKQQGGGVIVNVSSMASIDPFPGFSIYAAAKTGLNMFTKATATEGQPFNIRTVAVAPGAVETPMLRSLFDTDAIPPERAMPPKQVAQVIVDCLLGQRDFESGETILVEND